MRFFAAALAALACAAGAAAQRPAAGYHLIPGQFEPNRGPDGNSIFLDAPEGLILIDTGRHPEHSARLLAYARARGRPIVAIFNTHWHLDHSTGNVEIRAAYPAADLHASRAIDGALTGFLRRSRENRQRQLDAGEIPQADQAQARRFLSVMDNPDPLRPTRPVTATRRMRIGGRELIVHLAPFAVTEGDVWIEDRRAGLVIAGDLVVTEVPFMDTACPEGWRRALDTIAATGFRTLIPGHGEAMTHPQFMAWRAAFNNLIDCGASDRPKADCVAGWQRDAAQFIPAERRAMIAEYAEHYIESRLRSAPEERGRYCPPNLMR